MRAEEEQKHRQDDQANNRPFRGGPEGEPSFYMVGNVHCAAGRMIAGWMIFLGHALPRYQAVASRGPDYSKALTRAKGSCREGGGFRATFRRANFPLAWSRASVCMNAE